MKNKQMLGNLLLSGINCRLCRHLIGVGLIVVEIGVPVLLVLIVLIVHFLNVLSLIKF